MILFVYVDVVLLTISLPPSRDKFNTFDSQGLFDPETFKYSILGMHVFHIYKIAYIGRAPAKYVNTVHMSVR